MSAAGAGEASRSSQLVEALEGEFLASFSAPSAEFSSYQRLKEAGVDQATLGFFLTHCVGEVPVFEARKVLESLRQEKALRESFVAVQTDLTALQEKLSEVLSAKADIDEKIAVLDRDASQYERQLKEIHDPKLLALREALVSCESETKSMVQSKTALNQAKATLEKEKENLLKQSASFQKNIEDSRRGIMGRIQKLETVIAGKEVELAQAIVFLNTLKPSVSSPREALSISVMMDMASTPSLR